MLQYIINYDNFISPIITKQVTIKVKRPQHLIFYTAMHLREHDQQQFTMRSGVLIGNDTGGAAQVAAARCQNERTV